MLNMDDFDSACSSEAHYIQHQHQAMLASKLHRSRSMPHVNPQTLVLLKTQLEAAETKRSQFIYALKEDSGIESSHHSDHQIIQASTKPGVEET